MQIRLFSFNYIFISLAGQSYFPPPDNEPQAIPVIWYNNCMCCSLADGVRRPANYSANKKNFSN